MLHSGSRGIGHNVANHYDKVAKLNLQKKGVDTDTLKGIHYMPIESQEGQDYLTDMEWCQRYAFHNRHVMQKTMLDILEQVTGKQANIEESVNIHHNYCACEDCGDGRKLWVTRKGATSAKLGELGIIPGSMGTGSFITRGRGNPLSWSSSSHGAGRRMSRTRASLEIPQEEFEKAMEGVVCDTHPNVRDEAPQAYKDLTQVMKNQESLTDIVHHLLPLVNVKGFSTGTPRKQLSEEEQAHRVANRKMAEMNRYKRKLTKITHKINELSTRLQSKAFFKHAEEEVVNSAKARLRELKEEASEVKARLASYD